MLARPRHGGLDRLVGVSARSVRGRVIVVDRSGRVVADSAGPGEVGASYADRPEISAALGGRAAQLTRHSRTLGQDLLAELMRSPGRVVKREDLMARVWDRNWFGSTKTLDVHIGWLRRKLGDDPSGPRFIETVRGIGFRLLTPEESQP